MSTKTSQPRLLLLLIILGSLLIKSCSKDEEEKILLPPTINIVITQDEIVFGENISISVNSDDEDGFVERLEVFLNGSLVQESSNGSTIIQLEDLEVRTHNLKVIAYDNDNNSSEASESFSVIAGIPIIMIDNIEFRDEILFISCIISSDGGSNIFESGIKYSDAQDNIDSDKKILSNSSENTFEVEVDNLNPGTTYYFIGYAINEAGENISSIKSVEVEAELPEVELSEINTITGTSAFIQGKIIFDGGDQISSKGVVWGLDTLPTTANNRVIDSSNGNEINVQMSSLDFNTKYYVRIYATNEIGISYSNTLSFSTIIEVPSVSTLVAQDVEITTAILGGSIENNGGANITNQGIIWGNSSNLSLANDNVEYFDINLSNFEFELNDLDPSTKYYYQAFAENEKGFGYGVERSFITDDIPSAVIKYDDGSDEGHLFSTDNGDQWMVRFKIPSSFSSPKISSVQVQFDQSSKLHSSMDIGIYSNYKIVNNFTTDYKNVKFPNGSFIPILRNQSPSKTESFQTFTLNRLVNSDYVFIGLKHTDSDELSVDVDITSSGTATSSFAYSIINNVWGYFKDAHFLIRMKIVETDVLGNIVESTWIYPELENQTKTKQARSISFDNVEKHLHIRNITKEY